MCSVHVSWRKWRSPCRLKENPVTNLRSRRRGWISIALGLTTTSTAIPNKGEMFSLPLYLREALDGGGYFRVDVELSVSPARSALSQRHKLTTSSPAASELTSSTGSDQSLNLAKGWLEGCIEEHSECNEGASITPPTRLVEIGASGIRLYTT